MLLIQLNFYARFDILIYQKKNIAQFLQTILTFKI